MRLMLDSSYVISYCVTRNVRRHLLILLGDAISDLTIIVLSSAATSGHK